MSEETKTKMKLLKFSLAGDYYLLAIDVISEILRYQPVTKVPTIPEVVHGVLNLRGKYIPVIDLAKRLVIDKDIEITEKTCIVVTECHSEDDNVTVGLIIDEVSDFLEIEHESVAPPPKFGHSIAAELIEGMTRIDGDDYLILNVDKLLDLQQLIELLESLKDDEEAQASA
ncbi:purine-binding chemotaxis protein CheW [Aliikangiella marina]|uniref:Purine-binding chemotaxis protein CheW n=1 Tax=Aliikangiella marina TaxID=1712262 RepID=A0A545T4Z3_9GAMM|nr:chemotaxis protein CheW [Aliikangiella marina]TQV72299.1 purine-binding chemotaxis protein CheW [Aliikangiella marina]